MAVVDVDLGMRLRLHRVARRKTIREVSRATGIAPAVLSDIELSWQRARPDQLQRICAAIGISPRDLQGRL